MLANNLPFEDRLLYAVVKSLNCDTTSLASGIESICSSISEANVGAVCFILLAISWSVIYLENTSQNCSSGTFLDV